MGEASGVIGVAGGGVSGLPKEAETGPLKVGDDVFEKPGSWLASPGKRESEGFGDSRSLALLPYVPILVAMFFSFLMSDLYPLMSSL